MTRISLSDNFQTIESIWNWYIDQSEALYDYRNKIFSLVVNFQQGMQNKFVGFTLDELNEYFDESKRELEHVVCFNLISLTEAYLRTDFYTKVYNKDKSNIGRIYREIYKQKNNKISLKEDIIKNWQNNKFDAKSAFSKYIGLINYRHWLAHGRYWVPKFGQKYTPEITYNIVEQIIKLTKEK